MEKGIGTPKIWGLQGRGETRGRKREGRCRGLQSNGETQELQWRRELQRAGREGRPGSWKREERLHGEGRPGGCKQPHPPFPVPAPHPHCRSFGDALPLIQVTVLLARAAG